MGQKRHYRDRLKSIVINQPTGLTLAKYQATKVREGDHTHQ